LEPGLDLLALKLLLAHYRPWTNRFQHQDLAQYWLDIGRSNGLRCGRAEVILEDGNWTLVIAFYLEDRKGAVYFDPNDGSQRELEVGYPFPVGLAGVDEYCCISAIEVDWVE